ncbi:MAG: hypothetical protein JXR78_15730 [Victivallales bacterium]|nr:hypothetical protein [Victivallales bacterium]
MNLQSKMSNKRKNAKYNNTSQDDFNGFIPGKAFSKPGTAGQFAAPRRSDPALLICLE